MAGLKVNFSTEESSSEGMDFTPLPAGKYPVIITDGSLEESKSEKNKGKPYWHLELTIVEGHPDAGRKFWTNVMLFDGALYSLAQLDKATGEKFNIVKTGNVPALDDIIGEEIVVRVSKERNKYLEEKQLEAGERTENDPPIFRNEVKAFLTAGTPTATPAGKASSSKLP